MKLKVKKTEHFLLAPLFHKEQPVPFKSRGHLYIVKQEAFENECRSLVPLQHHLLRLRKCHKPRLSRNMYHDTKVILFTLNIYICVCVYIYISQNFSYSYSIQDYQHWQGVILSSDFTGVISAALYTPSLPFSWCCLMLMAHDAT